MGSPKHFNFWGEEEAQQLHLLRSNLIVDCRFRREDVEELFTAHLLWISTDGTEDLQEPCTLAVLGGSNVLEVIQRPVEDVAVEVIHNMTGRNRTQPRERHQHVNASITEIVLQLRIV